VPQEGADAAANAFLKLLEEPPADTTLVLTSSEPGALLPTIRSRVVALRVSPLGVAELRDFLADPAVRAALAQSATPVDDEAGVRATGGAPGALFAGSHRSEAFVQARRLLDAASSGDRAAGLRTAFALGASRTRGGFENTLDALTVLLHGIAREGAARADVRRALGATRAVDAVERAKERACGNVSPQLLGASLVRELTAALG